MMVARPARYDRMASPPQAARRSGRLPAVKHGYALRAVSLRDYVPSCGRIGGAPRALCQSGLSTAGCAPLRALASG